MLQSRQISAERGFVQLHKARWTRARVQQENGHYVPQIVPNLLQIGHDGDRQVPHFVEIQRTQAGCLDVQSINYKNQTTAFVCIIYLNEHF